MVFDDPPVVEAGKQYAILIYSESCETGNSQFYLRARVAEDPYPVGIACLSERRGLPWTCSEPGAGGVVLDFIFATYVTTQPPPASADVAVSIDGASSVRKGAQLTLRRHGREQGPGRGT